MAFTQNQLNALEEAIAQGAIQVKYQDKEVHYQSLNEMLTLRDLMKKALNITRSDTTRVFTKFSKGL